VWDETLDLIKSQLNLPTFNMWFANTHPLELDDERFVLAAPNKFAKEWLESRYLSLIRGSLQEVIGQEVSISLVLAASPAISSDKTVVEEKNQAKELGATLPDIPHSKLKYTFDSFVIGSSNRFAHAAALAVAEKPTKAYNPLFIYGGVGLGKTHLLQAINNYVLSHHQNFKSKYVSSEKFTNDFINSIRDKNKIVGFQKRYRGNDVLLIDDIQFLENKEATQEEFFHTFNTLYEAGKQIVISSDRPPKDIATLEDRLRTRFESGLTVDIQPPDIETRIAILRKQVQHKEIAVSDEVLEMIASKIQSNIRELEGALTRIVAFSSLTNDDIDVVMAEEILKDIFPNHEVRPVTIEVIQKEVSRFFRLSVTDLISKKRSHSVLLPRQIAMYLARDLTDLSLPKIGAKFGGRDHTTVLHAVSKVEKMLSEHRDVYNQVKDLTNKIKQRC